MSDVICISSDDESDIFSKNNKNADKNKKLECKLNVPLKRKSSSNLSPDDSSWKKIRQHNELTVTSDKTSFEKSRPNDSTKRNCRSEHSHSGNLPQLGISKNVDQSETKSNLDRKVIVPQLIVKNKVPIPEPSEDVFNKFLQACERKKADESTKKILSNLKKRYSKLEKIDKECTEFILFLNCSLQKVSNNYCDKFYSFIQEVHDEIKRRIQKPKMLSQKEFHNENNEYDSINNENGLKTNVAMLSEVDMQKVQQLEKTIQKCREKIKELEEKEVDFDEEEDSAYLQEDRYKRKLVQLCAMLSKIVNDNMMKKEIYKRRLKRKDIPDELTGIISADEAILDFVNSGIKKVNKLRHIKNHTAIADYLTVPDYQDILQCITKCNQEKCLNLTKKKMENLANSAFKSLLRHLKKQRIQECDDYISSYVEVDSEGDPAIKNSELNEKLQKNKEMGEKNLKEIFKLYEEKEKGLSPEDLQKQTEIISDEGVSEIELSDQIPETKIKSGSSYMGTLKPRSESIDESHINENIVEVNINEQISKNEINGEESTGEQIEDPLKHDIDHKVLINLNKSRSVCIESNIKKKNVDILPVAIDDEIEILSDNEPIMNTKSSNISNATNVEDCIKTIGNCNELTKDKLIISKNGAFKIDSINNSCENSLNISRVNVKINSPNLNIKESNKSGSIESWNNINNNNLTKNETASDIVIKMLKTNITDRENSLQTIQDKNIDKSQKFNYIPRSDNKNVQTDSSKTNIDKSKKIIPKGMTKIPADIAEIFEHNNISDIRDIHKKIKKIEENKISSHEKLKSVVIKESVVEENLSFIKVKAFAKPPESWKDIKSPEKSDKNLKPPIQQIVKDLSRPECVDLTNEKESRIPCTRTRIINPLALKKANTLNNNLVLVKNIKNYVSFPTDAITVKQSVTPKNIRITSLQGKSITITPNQSTMIMKTITLNSQLTDKTVQVIPLKFANQEQNKQLKNPTIIK